MQNNLNSVNGVVGGGEEHSPNSIEVFYEYNQNTIAQ